MDDIALLVLVGALSQIVSVGTALLVAWGSIKLMLMFMDKR